MRKLVFVVAAALLVASTVSADRPTLILQVTQGCISDGLPSNRTRVETQGQTAEVLIAIPTMCQ